MAWINDYTKEEQNLLRSIVAEANQEIAGLRDVLDQLLVSLQKTDDLFQWAETLARGHKLDESKDESKILRSHKSISVIEKELLAYYWRTQMVQVDATKPEVSLAVSKLKMISFDLVPDDSKELVSALQVSKASGLSKVHTENYIRVAVYEFVMTARGEFAKYKDILNKLQVTASTFLSMTCLTKAPALRNKFLIWRSWTEEERRVKARELIEECSRLNSMNVTSTTRKEIRVLLTLPIHDRFMEVVGDSYNKILLYWGAYGASRHKQAENREKRQEAIAATMAQNDAEHKKRKRQESP